MFIKSNEIKSESETYVDRNYKYAMWHCIMQCKLQMPAEINSSKRIEEIFNLIHDTVLF